MYMQEAENEQNCDAPFFTVITICFNDLVNLHATALSVQAQRCRDFEWWVIDGGSKDGTSDWLAAQKYSNLKWVSEPDRGLYHAMNKGMDRANGRYLIFMNSGDCFADDTVLEKMRQSILAQASPPILAYGDSVDVVNHASEGQGRVARHHRTVAFGMFAQHQAMAFAATSRRYDEKLRLSADYGFIAAAVAQARKETDVLRLSFPVCRFLLGGLNETRRAQALSEDYYIRRWVLGLSWWSAGLLYAAHWTHMQMKTYWPSVGRRFRRL